MRGLTFLPLAMAFACAFAQPMSDPMRPPGAAEQGASESAAPAGAGLQAVLVSPGRKLAIIDGAVVPLGAPARNGKLSGLSDSSAVVRHNGERDVLLMHPSVDKRPARRSEAK